jgi:phosphoribosylformylglycinamidine synthase
MAFAGGLGMELFLREVPFGANEDARGRRDEAILFSESNSRFIVEVDKNKKKEFEKSLRGVSFGLIGCVNEGKDFKVYGLGQKACISADIYELKEAWQKPLRW